MGVSGGWGFDISDKAPGGRGGLFNPVVCTKYPTNDYTTPCLYSITIVAFDLSWRGIAAAVHNFYGR